MTMTSNRWVGLDVHARQSRLAVLDVENGELRSERVVGAPLELVEVLASLGPGVRAVYEAGPTGFGLARAARDRGIDVRVCTPGSVRRKPGDRIKTDKRDAERLARLAAAGELTFARVPTPAEEQLRDLVRAREDLRVDLIRARNRLTKFLLRHDLRYVGHAGWSGNHLCWLRTMPFEDAASHATFADYLASVDALQERRTALDRVLAEVVPASPFAETIARLRRFRGIDTLTAAGLCAEIGDFARFDHPSGLSAFVGLVPSEWTTGEQRRQGAITKAGPIHARRLLVEAAHHARRPPKISEQLQVRQHGQDPRVCAIAWRAQRRLHHRWQRLWGERRKPSGVVVIACARELSTFLWEAATLV